MTSTDRTSGACLIGWSQLTRFDGEPLAAWAEALRQTGVPARAIDSLDVVFSATWPYDDPPRRVAEAIGAAPARLHYAGMGGTMPLQLLSAAAERIAAGESRVCAIVGGEALGTVRQLKKAGERPAWSFRHPEKQGYPLEAPFHPAEIAHSVFQAYTTFALRDIARRAHLGTSPEEHRRSLGELFAPMSSVAAKNPYAWFPVERTVDEVVTVRPDNRMVDYPYTKLLVSIPDVDLSAALVVASIEAADDLGIPEDHRVHLRGWAGAQDPDYVAEHLDLWEAPGMRHAQTHALRRAGLELGELDVADLYSCFPSAVRFALDVLDGIGGTPGASAHLAPFTVTGGLPYAGGAGSNYALGSTAAMCDRLTSGDGAGTGLLTGVGMHLSKHQAMVVSTTPGPLGDPAPAFVPERRPIVDTYDGEVGIASYTVRHGGDGAATEALLVTDVDPATGGRGYAIAHDPDLLVALEAEEWVGRTVTVAAGDGTTPNLVTSA